MEIPALSFKSFFVQEKRGTRQQRGYTGQTRLHQNLVPHVHKIDPSKVRKVEDLRDQGPKEVKNKKVLTAKELQSIQNRYNIRNISPTQSRKLGRSNITLYFDPQLNAWCLKK